MDLIWTANTHVSLSGRETRRKKEETQQIAGTGPTGELIYHSSLAGDQP
jgi:hypothetical protein